MDKKIADFIKIVPFLDAECPHCKKDIQISTKKMLTQHKDTCEIPCPKCKTPIPLKGLKQFYKDAKHFEEDITAMLFGK